MATNNLITKSFGNIEIQSGSGTPDHFSTKGSLYTDVFTGYAYVNKDGLKQWRRIQNPNNVNLYMDSNTTTTNTVSGTWSKFQGIGELQQIDSLGFTYSSEQIIIISATGDGGFQNTITTGTQGFADNGWIVVNGAVGTNRWFVGTTGASGSGFGAYVSGDGGATNTYTTGAATSYFYRDVQIPPYVTFLTLSFAIRITGDANDYTRVYNFGTTQNITAGVNLTGQLLTTSVRTGYQILSTTFQLTPQTVTQSRRIAFSWNNNATTTVNPPSSIDKIELKAIRPLELTYTGSQSLFKSFLSGSFQSTTAITNVGFQISKNGVTQSNISETRYNSNTALKEGFSLQNIFTMSSGDTISPLVVNSSSSLNVVVSDFVLNVIEISN